MESSIQSKNLTESGVAKATVVGGGVIGASWAALFLANGVAVTINDPDPDIAGKVETVIGGAAPALAGLGYQVGGLIGEVSGRSAAVPINISNSSATGNVTVTHNTSTTDSFAGGLVGEAINGNISDSHASGNVSGTGNNIGGLVGYITAGSILGSTASGDVSGAPNSVQVAGLIGGAGLNAGVVTVTDSSATGSVSGFMGEEVD